MFDLGWQEFLLVAIITVIVVGPKDLPRVVRSISQWVRKARSMAREFQSSLEEVAREAELDDVRREVQSISKDGIGKSIEKQIDPDGSMRETVEEARKSAGAEEIEADLKALDEETKSAASEPMTPTVETPAATPAETDTPKTKAPKAKAPKAKTAKAKTAKAKTAKAKTSKVETAEDYAAKSVAPPEQKTGSAPGTTAPAEPEKPRPAADSAASGQG